jgi:hypothetical protein
MAQQLQANRPGTPQRPATPRSPGSTRVATPVEVETLKAQVQQLTRSNDDLVKNLEEKERQVIANEEDLQELLQYINENPKGSP